MQRYQLISFPTLKYFSKKSIIIDYNGKNTSSKILDWLQKINKPSIPKLKNISELSQIDNQNISVVFYGTKGTYQYHYFFRASLGKQEFNYYHISQNQVLKERKIPAIVGYVPYNKNKWVEFDKNFTIKQISLWFEQISIPDILPLNQLIFQLLKERKHEGLIVLNNKVDTQNLFKILKKYCPQEDFELICIQVDQKNPLMSKVIEWLKMQQNPNDQSKMIFVNGKSNMKYIYQQKIVEITQSQFLRFYEKYQKGILIGNPIQKVQEIKDKITRQTFKIPDEL